MTASVVRSPSEGCWGYTGYPLGPPATRPGPVKCTVPGPGRPCGNAVSRKRLDTRSVIPAFAGMNVVGRECRTFSPTENYVQDSTLSGEDGRRVLRGLRGIQTKRGLEMAAGPGTKGFFMGDIRWVCRLNLLPGEL